MSTSVIPLVCLLVLAIVSGWILVMWDDMNPRKVSLTRDRLLIESHVRRMRRTPLFRRRDTQLVLIVASVYVANPWLPSHFLISVLLLSCLIVSASLIALTTMKRLIQTGCLELLAVTPYAISGLTEEIHVISTRDCAPAFLTWYTMFWLLTILLHNWPAVAMLSFLSLLILTLLPFLFTAATGFGMAWALGIVGIDSELQRRTRERRWVSGLILFLLLLTMADPASRLKLSLLFICSSVFWISLPTRLLYYAAIAKPKLPEHRVIVLAALERAMWRKG